ISEQQARAEAAAQSMGDESRSVSVSGQNRTQDTGSAFRAWLPYIILIVVVVLWTGPWSHLPGKFSHKWSEHAISSVTQKPMASTFNFNPLSGGTSILASWLVAFFIFAVAYLFVYAGIANSLAFGFSKVGWPFVILAPILGWIGVALSGSNTSTNAMFGPIQAVAGKLMGLPVLLGPTLNSLGAEVGKPIAPQTASVGVSTSRFVRSEGEVIRHNMAWTLIVLGYLIL